MDPNPLDSEVANSSSENASNWPLVLAGAVPSDNGPAANDEDFDLNDLFSVRRPKDIAAGLGSGTKSVVKGVAAGLVSILAGPIMGYHKNGVKGLAHGFGAGVAGGIVFPIAGTVIGATQLARGVLNAPEAYWSAKAGMLWDDETRQWVEYDLPAAAARIPTQDDEDIIGPARRRAAQARGGEAGQPGRAPPKDARYYEVLGVPTAATAGEIKQAYYALARNLHPDKNPDDAEAKMKFQRVGEAYQVLGNEELRARYDEHGVQAVNRDCFVDTEMVFTMLFGSEKFDHLVGRLNFALLTDSAADLTEKESAEIQDRRQTRLAMRLAAMLRPHVDGHADSFRASMTAFAQSLAEVSFGEDMLHTIGFVYTNVARQALGCFGSQFEATHHNLETKFKVVGAAWRMFRKMRAVAVAPAAAAAGDSEPTPGNPFAGADEREIIPFFMEAIWSVTLIDIETTVQAACQKLLIDLSEGLPMQQKRAEALQELGNIFRAAKAPEGPPRDFLQIMEAAVQRAACKEPREAEG